MPIYNDLVSFLYCFDRSQNDINNFILNKEQILNKNKNNIELRLNDMLEDINRSLIISINKNKNEINKADDLAFENIEILEKEIATLKKVHNENIELAETKYNRAIKDAEKIYNLELYHIEKEIKELRHDYRIYNLRQENDRLKKIEFINEKYDKIEKEILEKIEKRKDIVDNEVELLKRQVEQETKASDESFVTIKTTHTQTSIRLNDFINQSKDKSNLAFNSLKKSIYRSLLPIKAKKEKAYQKYKMAEDKIQDEYAEKLKALNVVFDLQKSVYNETAEKLILENNKEISYINSKLNVIKSNIDDRKNELRKKLDIDLKNLNENEKASLIRKFNKDINNLNKLLANNIKNNLKELKNHEIEFQNKLYQHDVDHIKQINEWRNSKTLYEYEKNQKLLLEEKKLKHELLKLKEKENKILNNFKIDKQINTFSLNKLLLPIETQLIFASFLQDREINILNNEIEFYKSHILEQENKIINKFLFDEIKYQYHLNLAKLNKDFELAQVNVISQLELEQARQKRDHQLKVLKINENIQLELLNTTKYIELTKLETLKHQENLAIENLDLRLDYQTKIYKQESLIEFEKRQTIIHEINIKNQKLINNRKSQRTIQIAEQYANFHESINKFLFNDLYTIYNLESKLNNLLQRGYRKIDNIDDFKVFITNIRSLYNHYYDSILILLNIFEDIDQKLYENKIEDATEEKYRIKRNEVLNLYNQSINQVILKRDEILKQKANLDEQIQKTENSILRTNFIIDSYKRSIIEAKKHNNSKSVLHSKDMIKTFKSQNRITNKKLRRNKKELSRLNIKIRPLNKALKKLHNGLKREEKKLLLKKNKESYKYNVLLNYHLETYKDFKKQIIDKKTTTNNYLLNFKNLSELDEKMFNLAYKKIVKNHTNYSNSLIKYQQSFLNNFIILYNITLDEQTNVLDNFEKSTIKSLKEIYIAHEKFITNEEKDNLFLSKIYLEEKDRNDNLIKKANITMKNKIKTAIDNYKNYFNDVELKINKSKSDMFKARDIISENLNGVLYDLNDELDKNIKELKYNYRKDRNDKLKELANINNNLENIEKRSMLRTNAIIDRYNKNKTKALKKMNYNNKKLTDLIARLENDKINNIHNYNNLVKRSFNSLERFERNIPIDKKAFKIKSKYEQKNISRKEINTLKRSYKFKLKQIRENKK